MTQHRLVILESPFAGDVERNAAYARRCLQDSLARGEAPIASHLLYTQVLDDNDPHQRQEGILAGLAWRRVADAAVVYTDLGISAGMRLGIAAHRETGIPIEYRSLDATRVLVCAACRTVTCRDGIYRCTESGSGVIPMTVDELAKLDLEHPDYWEVAPDAPPA